MPLIEVTYPEGTLSDAQRQSLADELTTVMLRSERAPDTEFFRSITWVYLHELPGTNVLAAGKPVDASTFRIDVTTPEGALSDDRREEFVSAATGVVREIADIAEEEALTRIWVLHHEVADGSWGAGGQVIRFKALVEMAKREREQQAEPAGAASS
jgi:phenylpyruvate tautomerase PptA (4-oxalocrotonate tautomerase family)